MADLEASAGLDVADAIGAVATLAETAQQSLTDAFSGAVTAFSDALGEAATTGGVSVSSALGDAATLAGTSVSDALTEAAATGATAISDALTEAGNVGGTAVMDAGGAALSAVADDARTELSAAFSDAAQAFATEFTAGSAPVDAITTAATEAGQALTMMGTEGAAALEDIGAAGSSAGPALDTVTESAAGATSGAAGLEGALGGVSAASLAVQGNAAGAAGAVKGVSGEAAGAIGGVLALGAGIGFLAQNAVDDTSAQQRFNLVLGEFKDRVQTVNVGTLNEDLSQLAIRVGSSDDALQGATAQAFQFATASGFTGAQAATFAERLAAISARAVALRPDLGDVGDAANRLLGALASGRERALLPFALGLSQTAIQAHAAELGLTNADGTVGRAALAFAGADLAAKKFGATMEQDVAKGSENAAIQQRSLKALLEETLAAIAKPLIAPFLDLLKAAVPTVEALARVFTILGQSALPVVTAALEVFTPLLTGLADVLTSIPSEVLTVGLGLLALSRALSAVSNMSLLAGSGLRTLLESGGAASGLAAYAAAAVGVGFALSQISLSSFEAKINIEDLGKKSNDALRLLADQLLGVATAAGEPWKAVTTALDTLQQTADTNTETATRLGQAYVDAGVLTEGQFNRVMRDTAAGQQQAKADTEANTAAVVSQGTAFDRAKTAADAYKASLDSIVNPTLDATTAGLALSDATDKAGGAIAFTGAASRETLDALIAATRAAETNAAAQVLLTGKTTAGTDAMRAFTGRLVDFLERAGQSPAQIEALLSRLGLVSDAARTAGVGIDQADIPGRIQGAMTLANVHMERGTSTLAATGAKGGKDTAAQLTDTFAAAAPAGIEAGTRLADAALSQIARLVLNGTAFNAGYGAGVILGSAFAQGIRSQEGTVADAATVIARAAHRALMNAGSPTEHLFHDAGVGFMDALTAGALSRREDVAAAFVARIRPSLFIPAAAPSPAGALATSAAHLATAASSLGTSGEGATRGGGPLIGEQHFHGMDPVAAAREMSREASWVAALVRV